MKLYCLLKSQLQEWHERMRPLLESAAQHSGERYTADDIYYRAEDGLFQVWVIMEEEIPKALCVTEVTQYPLSKELCIVIMTGEEMPMWVFMIETLENFARDIGCKRIKGYARPGWERVIKQYGYEKTHVILEKIL